MRNIVRRKEDHLEICIRENVNHSHNYWNDVQLLHNPAPEMDYEDVDTVATLFGRKLDYPIIITAITGGCEKGMEINRTIAQVASEFRIGMAVGSQRAALEHAELARTYAVVKEYDVPLRFANIGAPQLPALSQDDISQLVDMVGADALQVHFNYLQECAQGEGEARAKGVLSAMREVRGIPVVAKETGAGITREAGMRFKEAGAAAVETGGAGGTSFSAVEYYRSTDYVKQRLGSTFRDWGIPTPVCVISLRGVLPVIATGGVSTGLDVARGVALGAEACGMAGAVLPHAWKGPEALRKHITAVVEELKTAMFLTGSRSLEDLRRSQVLITGPLADWMEVVP